MYAELQLTCDNRFVQQQRYERSSELSNCGNITWIATHTGTETFASFREFVTSSSVLSQGGDLRRKSPSIIRTCSMGWKEVKVDGPCYLSQTLFSKCYHLLANR